ncbi:hypothetical protein MBLNU13_g04188t2 [Cladosporium sp. NU13]
MFNWAKNAVGITEREYGPEAIQSVTQQGVPYTELTKDDLRWEVMDSTNVETKTFYMTADNGKLGLVQIIFSNVLGIRTTAQFNAKIIDPETNATELWASDNLDNFTFSDDKHQFRSKECSMEISEDGKSYHIKSSVNKSCIVDITFTQAAPGFAAGKNGTSNFGTDPQNPWGRMKHLFWPRCSVEGSFLTQKGPVDFKGRGQFIHALQGMKPHFAAARWSFANFQSPSYSAIHMEYTTPPSYGKTAVPVGGIAIDGKILIAGPMTPVSHDETAPDSDNSWPEPKAVTWKWEGTTADGQPASAVLSGSLGARTDRVDVMGEMPKFVKNIVAGASGTKPYIYQYAPKMTIKVTINGETKEEEGRLFSEATFIS